MTSVLFCASGLDSGGLSPICVRWNHVNLTFNSLVECVYEGVGKLTRGFGSRLSCQLVSECLYWNWLLLNSIFWLTGVHCIWCGCLCDEDAARWWAAIIVDWRQHAKRRGCGWIQLVSRGDQVPTLPRLTLQMSAWWVDVFRWLLVLSALLCSYWVLSNQKHLNTWWSSKGSIVASRVKLQKHNPGLGFCHGKKYFCQDSRKNDKNRGKNRQKLAISLVH